MRYVCFGRGTGLRVSEVALGGALFGTAWGYGSPPEEAARIIEAYLGAGGNFIDTADFYQAGQSETILGEVLGARREDVVLASKYTLGAGSSGVATTGNSRKAMVQALEASLRRLKTDRLDLYWVHMADGQTATEEILRGFDDLTRAGKILYGGFSDFPAWRIAHGATLAQARGWSPIAGVQLEYSLAERSGDRELLPMARAFGMGITAWSPLAGGLLSGKYRRGQEGRATTFGAVVHREDDACKGAILNALLAVATETGASPDAVALAWLRARGIIPIIGPRTVEQLQANLACITTSLSPDQIARLDTASAISLGFPHDFLAEDMQRMGMTAGLADRIDAPLYAVA
jgi:aryl-alcohol dehydrogenase-like predicted oxidoreductase